MFTAPDTHSACIHVSSRKLKLPKDTHTKRYKQLLPTHPFPKVELYIAVKCKQYTELQIMITEKKEKNHTHAHTHVLTGVHAQTDV